MWGVRITVWEHSWNGKVGDWCPKYDAPTLNYSWDGDANFNDDNMAWLDIGDGYNMHDLTSTYEIVVDADYPTVWFCVDFYHIENYTYNTLSLPLNINFKHTRGVKDVIHGSLNLYHNDSFDSVKIDYKQTVC